MKVIGLLLIFGYAFFKFAWAYRLFNYAAVLVGAHASASSPDAEERALISAARPHGRGGRASLHARSTGVLFRTRLSRLVPEPVGAAWDDGLRHGGNVDAAIHIGCA